MKIHKVENEPGKFMLFCPACKCGHWFNDTIWQFNGDMENPTISPSLLVRSGHYAEGKTKEDCEMCKKERKFCHICHSYVTNGKIEFLSDSTHDMAGQTVDLEDF